MTNSFKRVRENAGREKYWNEDYVAYWKARVEEANNSATRASQVVSGDAKTSTDNFYTNAIGLLDVGPAEEVLELGCGFGRSLPLLCGRARHVSAVDISEEMINAARKTCQKENVSFHVSPSEELPFPNGHFDVIVCFAAFDAMYQTEALIEMNRVGKKAARILLTGKNDNYHEDDEAALAAEVGARNKGHPNYFTDVRKFVDSIEKFGFSICAQKYYSRRGDTAKEAAKDEMPEYFYEYLLVLKKIGECRITENFVISEDISKTFRKVRK